MRSIASQEKKKEDLIMFYRESNDLMRGRSVWWWMQGERIRKERHLSADTNSRYEDTLKNYSYKKGIWFFSFVNTNLFRISLSGLQFYG